MNVRLIGAAAAGLALLAAAGWLARDTAPMLAVERPLGLAAERPAPSTTETLHAAGVRKCQTPSGILYVDAACPSGSRELKATGGTLTVMPFPRAAPVPAALASDVLGGALVKPTDREARDRLRDRPVDDAASRR